MSTVAVCNFYYYFISRDCNGLIIFTTALGVLAFFGCLIALPESPKYLVAVGKPDEAIKVFNYIAWFNGSSYRLAANTRFEESQIVNQNNQSVHDGGVSLLN